MTNKNKAQEFLKLAASGEVDEAYREFIAPHFIHHNQYFKGDRQSLLEAMKSASITHPNKCINIKKTYEDGDTVITHSEVIRNDPALEPIAVVHIFRFEQGKVVELWDLGQERWKDTPNENGLF